MTVNDDTLCKSNIEILKCAALIEGATREGQLHKLGELYSRIYAASREADWRINEILYHPK